MTAVAIIPARFGSTRLPGKALLRDTGKYLVQHVYESVRACDALERVIVATDDDRIAEAVRSFAGQVCLTRPDHPSGTDRVGEAVASLGLADDDIVINVQGDEPELTPDMPTAVIAALAAHVSDCSIATVAAPFDDDGPTEGPGSPLDPNRVKVVVDRTGCALYFSRSLIPYPRDTAGRVDQPSRWLLHMGIYGFSAGTLRAITQRNDKRTNSRANAESLEQLRWLEAGYRIAVSIMDHRFVGIDSAADYAAFVERLAMKCET